MYPVKYNIDFHSYWHIGSGLSEGSSSDLLVLKDDDQLPFIPGKTIKGLLRHAAEEIHQLNNDVLTNHADFIIDVFGKEGTNESKGHFSNACLPIPSKEYFKQNSTNILYHQISSTKINSEKGIAEQKSLRQMEVTVPLRLEGEILLSEANEDVIKNIEICLSWIKQLGMKRTRGFGQCTIKKQPNK